MMISALVRWLKRWSHATKHSHRRETSRPLVEVLEARNLPATLTVSSLADGGPASLRGALAQAQSGDTIEFASSLNGGTIFLSGAQGELQLQTNVTIQGPGASNLTVSGNNASRVFSVFSGVNASITGLTITGGRNTFTTLNTAAGGGILNNGTLSLEGCIITGNTADASGPITSFSFGGGIFSQGNLSLTNCTVSGNTAHAGAVGTAKGGGIYMAAPFTLTLTNSTVTANVATGAALAVGGGICGEPVDILQNAGPTLILSDCSLTNNTAITPPGVTGNPAALGGGIYVAGGGSVQTVSLVRCQLVGNAATGIASAAGGGLYGSIGGQFPNMLTLSRCTIATNQVAANAVAGDTGTTTLVSAEGGGIWAAADPLMIGATTIAGNTVTASLAAGGGGGGAALARGGGIYSEEQVTLSDSTVSGNMLNVTAPTGEGISAGGGLYYQGSGTLDLTNCTIAANVASDAASTSVDGAGGGLSINSSPFGDPEASLRNCTIAGNSANGSAGGIEINEGALVEMINTIVARNTVAQVPSDVSGAVVSRGHNLIGAANGSSGWGATDLTGSILQPLNPLLGPLQNNGGPTATLALLAGSPAINAGDNSGAPAFDQRGPGFPRIANGTIDLGAFEVQPTPIAPLRITSVTGSPTGFTALFNRPLDLTPLNLYSGGNSALDPPDGSLTGAVSGPIAGSLVVSGFNDTITFVRTGGLLPADTYTLRLRSAANGFKDTSGGLLDGNGDGTPGDDFVSTFTFAPTSGQVVGIPDFARGPGQSVNVPATSSGLPLRISDGSGVTSVAVTLRYNPALLTILFAAPAAGTPTDSQVTLTRPTTSTVRLTFTSPSGLGSGPRDFVTLAAGVPSTATYGDKQVLGLGDLQINGAISFNVDDGLHVVAYFGDASGNARYSSADATRILRVAVGLDAGFAAFPLADPRILADIDGNGRVSSLDATRALQEALGIDQDRIPPLPANPPIITVAGPDPVLRLPPALVGRPGETLTLPVLLDSSDGLESADLAISYDAERLEVVEVRRGTLTGDFDVFLVNHANPAGTLRIGLGRTAGPIVGVGAGSVAEITFRVRESAPAGRAFINLRESLGETWTALNEGGLDLNPDPTDSPRDAVDGGIIVVAARSPLTRTWIERRITPQPATAAVDQFFASLTAGWFESLRVGQRRKTPRSGE